MHRRDGPEAGPRAPRGAGSLVRDDHRAEGGGLALRMLELQRTAGNAATTALLRGAGAGRVVQRDPKDPAKEKAAADKAAAAALKKLKADYTYAFWALPEAKGAQPDAAGAAKFMVNGVRIAVLPDRLLTEKEFQAEGGSFKVDGHLYAARTTYHFGGVTFDPKSVKTSRVDDKFMVDDYAEPVAEVQLRTTYRKTSPSMTLADARRQSSGYGKGRTLQDHEASHSVDAIAYVQANGPRLAEGRGMENGAFNDMLTAYYAAATGLPSAISAYSKARTDCPGTRDAVFCKAAKTPAKAGK
jgi:hypothetical protein